MFIVRFPLMAVALCMFSICASAKDQSLLGNWFFYLPTPDGVEKVTAVFVETEDGAHGSFEGQHGRATLRQLTIEGERFSFEHEVDKFFLPVTLRFSGKTEGHVLSGAIETPMGEKSFHGVRQ